MRQVSHNKQSSEPVDVAVSQTAQPTTGSQDVKERINSKGDLCASPLRQVFQHDSCTGEPVDEAIIEKTEHTAPQAQHPLTQDGNKRRTKDERAKWRVANGLNEKRSRTD
jgi:hypothetical protein